MCADRGAIQINQYVQPRAQYQRSVYLHPFENAEPVGFATCRVICRGIGIYHSALYNRSFVYKYVCICACAAELGRLISGGVREVRVV